jgi:23S rRNA (cytidine1920-2'-O)/16S rRNA (cytidine1409-2'-O)-methyltransferase
MRLDKYLTSSRLVLSRSQAYDYIKRGFVYVNHEQEFKPAREISTETVEIKKDIQFVSRAGEKLQGAILDFGLVFDDKIVIDIGSSTGGFTQCALIYGAKKVFSYDVGTHQMDQELRKDPRIELHEETNILDVVIPEADIILIDVSFTSIKPILTHLKGFTKEIVALIKPQFEAGPIRFKKGVLHDEKMHELILNDVMDHAESLGFHIAGLKKSQLKGKLGNQEYVLYMKDDANEIKRSRLIGGVL